MGRNGANINERLWLYERKCSVFIRVFIQTRKYEKKNALSIMLLHVQVVRNVGLKGNLNYVTIIAIHCNNSISKHIIRLLCYKHVVIRYITI